MNQERHLPFLDTFRGIAILAVVARHTVWSVFDNLSSVAGAAHHAALAAFFRCLYVISGEGTYGVAIFFVVSGFCINLSYRKSQDTGWGIFYVRRIFRIYPAYLVSLLFFLLVLPITRWPADAWGALANQIDFVLHLFLAQNFLPQTLGTINGAYWSLAIEFQLYLLFPLILLMARRIGWRQTLIVTAFVELVSRVFALVYQYHEAALFPASWFGWYLLSPLGFWFSWTLGAILAEAFVEKQPLPFSRPLPLWLWPLVVVIFDQTPFLRVFAFPVAAWGTGQFLVYHLNKEPAPAQNTPIPVRVLNFVGVISYSIYLLHQPIYHYVIDSHMGGGFAIKFVFAITVFMATSYILYLFVETPGIRAGKALVKLLRQAKFTPTVELT